MSNTNGTRGFPHLLMLAAIIVVIAALYLAQELLIPVALAVLFCFMLAPVAKRLERVGLGRIPSVILVVLFSFSIFGFVGWTVARQLVSVTAKLPEYKDNIHHKVQSLRGKTDTHLSQLSNAIKEIRQELATQPATQTAVVMPANSQEMQRSEDHGDAWMKSAP